MPDSTQDFTAKKTYRNDWTAHLAAVGRTITGATVTSSAGTVTGTTFTTTGVWFRLDTTAIPTTAPTVVTVTVTPTLDNGDVDARHYKIQVTNT